MSEIALRGYQADDVARLERALGKHQRVLYVLPTAAGKTIVAAAIMRARVREHQRLLFLAHRREIVQQAMDRLIASGVPEVMIGVIMAGAARVRSIAPIQLASVDTLRRRDVPGSVDLVIVDEAHRAAAASYRWLIAELAAPVLGLTATPKRLDGKGLAEDFDKMVVGPQSSELLDAGWLARLRAWTVPENNLPDLSDVRLSGGDYQRGQLEGVMNTRALVGNIVEHWQRLAAEQRTVVFCVGVEHSRHVRESFATAGVAAEHLDGETPTRERAAVLQRLRNGATRVLTNCDIVTEGWDEPSLKCIVMARPTKSLRLYLQMVGRAARPWENAEPRLLDHAGNVLRHGMPQMDRKWKLATTRGRPKKSEPTAKACPECGELLEALSRECACGFVFWTADPPVEKRGQLVEVVQQDDVKRRRAVLRRLAKKHGVGSDWVRRVEEAIR